MTGKSPPLQPCVVCGREYPGFICPECQVCEGKVEPNVDLERVYDKAVEERERRREARIERLRARLGL